MAYTAFIKRLIHDAAMRNYPILSNLVIGRIEKYQDAQPIISCFLKLELLWENLAKNEQTKEVDTYAWESMWARHNKKAVPLEPSPSLLIVLIS